VLPATFRKNSRRSASSLVLVLCVSLVASVLAARQGLHSERPRIWYFAAPEYPPVARQAMQSGDVVLQLTVSPGGTVTNVTAKGPHPILCDHARATAMRWRFEPGTSAREIAAFLHYGFSGEPRECHPRTAVNADLNALRITVTVDPPPPLATDSGCNLPESDRRPTLGRIGTSD